MSIKDQFDRAYSIQGEAASADLDRGRFILEHIPDSVRTVLDAGCGTGDITRFVHESRQVTALDLSSVAVQKVRRLGIDCVEGSITNMPFADGSFDMVMACEVLEHLDEELLPRALAELHRLAKRYILITVPNRDRLQALRQECPRCRSVCVPWGHIRSFGTHSLVGLLAGKGFVVRTVETFGPLVTDLNSVRGRLLRWHRWRRDPLQAGKVCPVCKYAEPGPPMRRPRLADFLRRPGPTCLHALDYLAIRLSPKAARWILALYERT